MFFPEDRNKAGSKAYTAEVQTLREDYCWNCPVRVRCFEYCLEDTNSRLHGVMAGTTPSDRQEFIQVKCRCGGYIDPFDLVHHKSLYCKPCQTGGRDGRT